MKTLENVSRGGHCGDGGIQAWSAGDTFPWTLYVTEYYVPYEKAPLATLDQRFLWAEIRMRHPGGADLLAGEYHRGDSEERILAAHRQATAACLRAKRIYGILDDMARILAYGQPKLTRTQVAGQVVELAQEALATQDPPVRTPATPLFQNAGGFEECAEVDYYGGGCSSDSAILANCAPWGVV